MTTTELRDGLRKATPDEIISLACYLNKEYDYELRVSADPADLVDQMEQEVDVEDLIEAYRIVILKEEDEEEQEEDSGTDSEEEEEDEEETGPSLA